MEDSKLSGRLGVPLAATLLALTTMVISGTNNFLAKIAVKSLGDPIAYGFRDVRDKISRKAGS